MSFKPKIELDWQIERGPEWLFVRLGSNDLKEYSGFQLAGRLWELLEKHLTYRLVLEFDDISILDSEKISQMVLLSKRILEHDGMLRLSGISQQNRAVMEACNIEDLFAMYEDRHGAVMGSSISEIE
jgi:anti-sigma B factor antagonist